VSMDDGAHWRGLLHFADIRGPSSCLAAACAVPYAALEALYHLDAGMPDGNGSTNHQSGCACSIGRSASPDAAVILLEFSCFTCCGLRRGRRNGRRAGDADVRPQ
jgi:hypothetical protein